MSEVRIAAEPRTAFGKGGARRTRRAGLVPAVLYGHGTDPRHISLPARDFSHALRTEAGANVLLRVELDGSSELALPKAIQRDPLRGSIEHVDLLVVRRGEKVTVDVAVTLTGEAVRDGLVDQQLTTLSVLAEATSIPQGIEVSIAGLGIGDAVHAGDVKLPADVTLHTDPEAVVVHVMAAPTAEQVEAELAEAEADLGVVAPAAATEAEPAAEPSDAGADGAASPPAGDGAPAGDRVAADG